ncbi:MAG: DsrE family protein [Thermoplasma acidophilum]|nr:DsrE family protein [Thermoplasma acidophilum]
MKVIINVTEMEKVGVTIKSALNLLKEDPSAIIEIVFHADAISFLSDPGNRDAILNMLKSGMDVVACRNSLVSKKIDEKSLMAGVRIVNAGIYEVLKRESEGWLYIKL